MTNKLQHLIDISEGASAFAVESTIALYGPKMWEETMALGLIVPDDDDMPIIELTPKGREVFRISNDSGRCA
jgi:hypothetical protein